MEMSTTENFKMAKRAGMEPTFVLMGTNTTVDGSRMKGMEWESSNGVEPFK